MSVELCGVFVLQGISCTRILKNKLKAEHCCCCSCLSFSIDQCLKSGSDRCGVFFFFFFFFVAGNYFFSSCRCCCDRGGLLVLVLLCLFLRMLLQALVCEWDLPVVA